MSDFAVDTTHVYWSMVNDGQIMRVPISGGNPTTLAASVFPLYIALDANNVYWVSVGGDVMKVAVGGGDPIVLALGFNGVKGGIAVDATNVYWPIWDAGADLFPLDGHAAVLTVPISGGGTPNVLASGLSRPQGITADSRNVYWTAFDTVKNETVLMAAPKGDVVPTVLASGPMAPGWIATDASNVYTCADGDIMQVPITGGAPTVLAVQGGCGPMAVDANSLYWAKDESVYDDVDNDLSDQRATIMRVSLAGGPAAVLASIDGWISRIAVDGTGVYCLGMMTGEYAVMKLTPK